MLLAGRSMDGGGPGIDINPVAQISNALLVHGVPGIAHFYLHLLEPVILIEDLWAASY